MKKIAVLAAAAAAMLFSAQAALACQVYAGYDANGTWIGPPRTLEEHIATARVSFVGTVVGYRNSSGVLIEKNVQDCVMGCRDLADGVITVVLSVEHQIEGVEAGRFYEVGYDLGDGDCGPWFEAGHRYLYTSTLFGSPELDAAPSAEQLAYWRSLVEPNPPLTTTHRVDGPEPDCVPPPEDDILTALAPYFGNGYISPEDAYVARVVQLRLDDATLTDDTSPCDDVATPDCAAFFRRIVTVVVDIEAVVSGDRALGQAEMIFAGSYSRGPGAGCVPKVGLRHLMTDNGWPGFPLPDFPDEDQLNQWRAAIHGWRD